MFNVHIVSCDWFLAELFRGINRKLAQYKVSPIKLVC